jgi:predicted dehydrogenase
MNRPRLGFVGLGWIGLMRMEAVEAAGSAEVAALCEPGAERLEEVAAARPGAARFAAYDDLLAAAGDLGLDGVVVATPNALHEAQAVAAFERGLAVFCQKPLALDAAGTERILAAARAADRSLGVDWSYRETDAARELARSVAAGELGEIFAADAVFHNAYGPDKPWCWDAAVSGGGALVDLGVHLVDLVLWLLAAAGPAPRLAAVSGTPLRAGRPLAGRGVDDFTTARLELARDGAPPVALHLATSWNAHAGRDCHFRLDLHGTAASASFHNLDGSFYDFALALRHGRDEHILTRESAAWLGRALVTWTQTLATDPRYDPTVALALPVAQAIDAIYTP